jgi:hypothetical protein
MAITSAFKYTNTTAATTKHVSLYDMDETSNYALVEDEPTRVELNNTTTPIDAGEILSYRCKKVPVVRTNLDMPKNTTLVNKGVQYAVQLEADLVTSDSADASFRQDDPVVMYLTITHPLSGYITDALLGQHLARLISACQKEDGTWRFSELMRSALKPTED